MAQIVESNNFGQVRTPMRFWKRSDWLMRNREYCKEECRYNLIVPAHYIPDFEIVRPTEYTPFIDAYIDAIAEDGSTSQISHLPSITPEIFTIGDKDYLCWDSRKMYIDNFLYSQIQIPNTNSGRDCLLYPLIQFRVKTSPDGYTNTEWVSEPMKPMMERLEDDYFKDAFGTGLSVLTSTGGWSWDGTKWCNNGTGGTLTFVFPDDTWKKRYAKFSVTTSGATGTGGAGLIFATDASGGIVFPTFPSWHDDIVFNADGTLTITASGDWTGCIETMTVEFYTDEIDCHHKLTWANACDKFNMFNKPCDRFDFYDVETICYQADGVRRRLDGMLNEYFLPEDAELGFPDIKLVEEVIQNGEKNTQQVFQKRERRFHVDIGLVPEHILEALADIPFFENVILSLKNGAGDEKLTYFACDYNWEFSFCKTSMKLNFGFDDDIVDTVCCELLPLVKCCEEAACYEVAGFFEHFETYELVEGKYYIRESDGAIVLWTDGMPEEAECQSGIVVLVPEEVLVDDEMVVNGGFDGNADGWDLTLWDYSDGKICKTEPNGSNFIFGTLSIPILSGASYTVVFTISGYSSGSLVPKLYDSVTPIGCGNGTLVTGNGTFTQTIVATHNGDQIFLDPSTNFIGCIDDVSVKLVGEEIIVDNCCEDCPTESVNTLSDGDFATALKWNFSGGASWVDHVLPPPPYKVGHFLSTGTISYKDAIFVRCRSYKVTFTVLHYSAGNLIVKAGGIQIGTTYNANGTYSIVFKYDDPNPYNLATISFISDLLANLDIDDVSIVQLGCLGATTCCYFQTVLKNWIPMSGEISSIAADTVNAIIPEGYLAFIQVGVIGIGGVTWQGENLYCVDVTPLRVWTKEQLEDGVDYCHPVGDYFVRLFTFNNNCEAGYSEAVES